MAADLTPCDYEDEEYIDMEVSSNAYFFCNRKICSPHPSEFEFHMSSSSLEREPAASPADELFYKGKLLPLLRSPRLQMVEKFLHYPNSACKSTTDSGFEDFCSTPLVAAIPTGTRTPSESCNISPLESCRVSRELSPEDYCFNYSTEKASAFISDSPKKSWTRKLKLMKQFPLGIKLKASRAYLKSLSSKSGRSHQPNAADQRTTPEAKENLCDEHNEVAKYTFGQNHKSATVINSFDEEKTAKEEDDGCQRRRSFSVMIKRCLASNSALTSFGYSSGSSSSSSANSNGCYESKFPKRSNSARSEMESSIQGAIAHCKMSQNLFL